MKVADITTLPLWDVRVVTHIERGDSYSVGSVRAHDAREAMGRASHMIRDFQTFRVVPLNEEPTESSRLADSLRRIEPALEAVGAAKDSLCEALLVLPRDCNGWSRLGEAIDLLGCVLDEYEDDGYRVR